MSETFATKAKYAFSDLLERIEHRLCARLLVIRSLLLLRLIPIRNQLVQRFLELLVAGGLLSPPLLLPLVPFVIGALRRLGIGR